MSLNIKNPEAETLARELANYTGQSMTHEVIVALRERAERMTKKPKKGLAEELLAIGRSSAAKLKGKPIDHDEFHYDERGFFK
jgi:antitoxin VapB